MMIKPRVIQTTYIEFCEDDFSHEFIDIMKSFTGFKLITTDPHLIVTPFSYEYTCKKQMITNLFRN